jgi:phosphomannomutase
MQGTSITFGTDGWRGLIAADFTYDNAALAVAAVRAYLVEEGLGAKPLLIGYDRRFCAENYAAHIATYLGSIGQAVLLSDGACATPAVAVSVLHHDAAGAIMLTASHNPYAYQGLKFIPWFAGPAMPAATDRITALISEMAPTFKAPGLVMDWKGETLDLREPYFASLDKLVDTTLLAKAKIGGAPLKPYYTAMHGAGAGFFDAYLERIGCRFVPTALNRDVFFGGRLPDPSPANLQSLRRAAEEAGCNVILGTDGDADRFGLVDMEGRYFGANEALPMLAEYLAKYRGLSGAVVRTVATSHLLDGVAAHYGLPLIETAVGFKFVGNELRQGALIGGEESGGISIQGHVPEKDGMLACLLMLEMAAAQGKSWEDLLESQHQRFGARAYRRMDEHLESPQKTRLLMALRGYDSGSLAGWRIIGKSQVDGVKLMFDDGSWVMVRASGTEPVVRIYVEVTDPHSLDARCSDLRQALLALAG